MRTSISFSLGSKRGSASVTSVHNYAIAIQKARDFRNPTSKTNPQYPSKSHDFKKGGKGSVITIILVN
jgi:hypothetical protein